MPHFGHSMLEHWMLDPAILYLNHGTVGAVPRRVLAAQQAIRDEIERQPARFQLRELADLHQVAMRVKPRMRAAAEAVAPYVGADAADFAFVDNATTGANAVLGSLALTAGDEIVLTDHGYGAITHAARHIASRYGAVAKEVELPYPPFDDAATIEAIAAAIGPRTKLVVVDHIAAGSAAIFPVAAIVERCHAAGIRVLVDGAHVPGSLAVDVHALGADWYTGNLHKWAMAPRSSAFLWAAPHAKQGLHPTVISWGYELGFEAEFDYSGTRDVSPFLAAADGIAFMREIGDDAMKRWNHDLVWNAGRMLADRWNVTLPLREPQVATMLTLPLPERMGTTIEDGQRIKDTLLYEDGIEAQVQGWNGRVWLRLAAQVYNESGDYERLAKAIEARA